MWFRILFTMENLLYDNLSNDWKNELRVCDLDGSNDERLTQSVESFCLQNGDDGKLVLVDKMSQDILYSYDLKTRKRKLFLVKVAQSIRSMFALMVTGCLLQMTVRFQKLITKPVNVFISGRFRRARM